MSGVRYEYGEHRLMGRPVLDPATGRTGTLAMILIERAGDGRVVRRTAHVRPLDGSGWEWETDPRHLVAAGPVTSDTHPQVTQ